MATRDESPGPGGFLRDTGLLSPTPSTLSSAHLSSLHLPHPRARALKPGSSKEDLVRQHVSDRLLHISRRFVKKYALVEEDDEVVGYKSMSELCRDVEDVINILWLSGTPSLQVPYLLNVAVEMITWMDGFQPSPRATFSVLRKLDHCFASLLCGEDVDSKEPLPGFERGLRAGATRTDMIRCRSTAEQTRVAVVEVMGRGPPDPADNNVTYRSQLSSMVSATPATPSGNTATEGETEEDETEAAEGGGAIKVEEGEGEPAGDNEIDEEDDYDNGEDMHMNVARVYELTLVKLGEILGDDQAGTFRQSVF